ncbi:MAG: KamA family protein [Bacteroidales bacterium]
MDLFDLNINTGKKQLFDQLVRENPDLEKIFKGSTTTDSLNLSIRRWVEGYMKEHPEAQAFYSLEHTGRTQYEKLCWRDMAAIRILDYLDRNGLQTDDLNLRGKTVESRPFEWLWEEYKGEDTQTTPDFIRDMIYLFRQFHGVATQQKPSSAKVQQWMDRNPSGLDAEVIDVRIINKARIIDRFIRLIDEGSIQDAKYNFDDGMTAEEKVLLMNQWWNERLFHLRFAIRDPELLNEMLDNTLSEETMKILRDAKTAGIPTFVNPYYLSLLNVHEPDHLKGTDEAIREYVLYSRELVEEFGEIIAWEKEDIVEEGKPNAAGWILPGGHNIHRRYPEVAILIPDTMGRACGGLCSSCQRMYDFQSGHLNFNLDKLRPHEKWEDKLQRLMRYFQDDSQLRDILITGGDALMSSDKSLKRILDAVYAMAMNKIQANAGKPEGKKYAEILRIRLGTRLPVYLPQRITPELTSMLREFKEKASAIGIKQFVIQTHFESAMEVTPEAKKGIDRLLSAGWILTNQQVFTTGASKRGHTAKLRKVLNDVGVLPYYTFTVKGYHENSFNFATNERAVQEQIEEKMIGKVPEEYYDVIRKFADNAGQMSAQIDKLRKVANMPFLATDRNVLNIPGVGKSCTYRTVGITKDGRRILEFDHDHTRSHSPIISKMGKVIIVESKSVSEYLRQLKSFGEDVREYQAIYGYSIGETEPRLTIYEYPPYEYNLTKHYTNLEV